MEDIREQQVALSDYLRILIRNKWIILLCFIVVVSSTAYLTFTAQPVYEASALVLLKEQGRVERQILNATSFIEKEKRINNQVEILRSRTLAEDVIHRLQGSLHADSLKILGARQGEERFSPRKWISSAATSPIKSTVMIKIPVITFIFSSYFIIWPLLCSCNFLFPFYVYARSVPYINCKI